MAKAKEISAIVVLKVTEDDVELMRRWLFNGLDQDPKVHTMSDAAVVNEFALNAIDNMLDNCHDLRSSGELDPLPEPTEETPDA